MIALIQIFMITFLPFLAALIILIAFLLIRRKKSNNLTNKPTHIDNAKKSCLIILLMNTAIIIIPLFVLKINLIYILLVIFVNIPCNYIAISKIFESGKD